MKIKCPSGCWEKTFSTWEELADHLEEPHNHTFTRRRYAELLFKIHEKMQYYEEGQYPHEARILKSLLENEK